MRIGPIRTYFGPIRKKRADTHFFIPDTHNVVIIVWFRIVSLDAACMSGQSLNEKALAVLYFSCRARMYCAPRDVHTEFTLNLGKTATQRLRV